jgi:hypothetical protein
MRFVPSSHWKLALLIAASFVAQLPIQVTQAGKASTAPRPAHKVTASNTAAKAPFVPYPQ